VCSLFSFRPRPLPLHHVIDLIYDLSALRNHSLALPSIDASPWIRSSLYSKSNHGHLITSGMAIPNQIDQVAHKYLLKMGCIPSVTLDQRSRQRRRQSYKPDQCCCIIPLPTYALFSFFWNWNWIFITYALSSTLSCTVGISPRKYSLLWNWRPLLVAYHSCPSPASV